MSASDRATGFVKGLRIKATHLGYHKTIKKASTDTAKSYIFDCGEYGKVSVEEYFFKSMSPQFQFGT